jgi:hypothetical protein
LVQEAIYGAEKEAEFAIEFKNLVEAFDIRLSRRTINHSLISGIHSMLGKR